MAMAAKAGTMKVAKESPSHRPHAQLTPPRACAA